MEEVAASRAHHAQVLKVNTQAFTYPRITQTSQHSRNQTSSTQGSRCPQISHKCRHAGNVRAMSSGLHSCLLRQSQVRASDWIGEPLCWELLPVIPSVPCTVPKPSLLCPMALVWRTWALNSLLGLPLPILPFLCLPLLLAPLSHPFLFCESQAERDSPTRHHLKTTLWPHLAPLYSTWARCLSGAGCVWGSGRVGCSPLLPRGEQ